MKQETGVVDHIKRLGKNQFDGKTSAIYPSTY